MKSLPSLLATLLLTATAAHAAEIHVSVAISMKEAITDIAKQYKIDTGEDVTLTFGSSGQLETQIKNGADIDGFISAATDQIDDLEKANLTLDKSRRVVAGNTLVLIIPANAVATPSGIPDLADAKFKKIAIGDPKTVPAGDYAMQTLTALKINDALKDRLVYAANVRQVLTYVIDNDVSAGFVYGSDAKQAGDKVRVVAIADEKTHQPIEYPAVILKSSKHQNDAKKFLDYLKSDKAIKILGDKGFAPDPPPATAPATIPSAAPAQ